MLYELIEVYGKVGQSGRNDDDVYDRYSHRWTVILLGVFIIAISAKQFVGTPIECISPSGFDAPHKTYVENYCWIHYTYSVDDKTALTRNFVRGANGSRTTPYYIWIPYILLVAALCTYLPAWLWHVVGHRATFDIPAMINQIAKTDLKDTEQRKTTLTMLAKHFEKAQQYSKSGVRMTDNLLKRLLSASMFFAGGGISTGIYFLTKIFYLFNAIGQFYLINYYLQINYWSYGQTVLHGIIHGRDWLENKVIFPRIVYCDFSIRYLGDNTPNYTVQCTLPVNLYNERIFAFYWFWLIFLFCATLYGIITWLGHMSYRGRRSFLKKHLRIILDLEFVEEERKLFDRFTDRYLGGDGILLLRLLSKNTNPVIAGNKKLSRIAVELFHFYFLGELLGIMWERFVAVETKVEIVLPKEKTVKSDTYLNGGNLAKLGSIKEE